MVNGVFALLSVDDVEKTLAFYRSLGLKTSAKPMGPKSFGRVHSGEAVFVVYPKHDPGADPETLAWLASPLGNGVVLTVGVPNATKTYEKARGVGAQIDAELQDAPWGGKMFALVDPDGYAINFADRFPDHSPAKKATTRKPARRRVRPTTSKKARGSKRR